MGEINCEPFPDKEGPVKWYPLVRVGYYIPFGYVQDPEDPNVLLPVERELELLEQARLHLRKFSLRKVADWLSKESGRSISHMGLSKRVKIERTRRQQAAINRNLIERLEKALKKAQELEERRVGGIATFYPVSARDSETSTS